MPLATEVEIVPKPSEVALTPITPRPGQRPDGEFKNSVVDVRKRSIDTLLAHVEGSQWQITYYRQLLTSDMEPTSFQKLQNIPYQQYEKINTYPLKVTNPLSSSQNEENLIFNVDGSGILAFAIIPNVGDVFYADIGDGRYGLFSIEKIVRKTILKDSVYEVDYTLLEYKTEENETLLNDRVVRELYYSRDHLGAGRGSLITSVELNDYRKISDTVKHLFDYHLHKFLDKNNTTLLRPDNNGVYDPYFSLFWDKILPKDDIDLVNIPRIIIVGDEFKDHKTIWDCFLIKTLDQNQINIGMKIEKTINKDVNLIYNGISLTSIEEVISVDTNFQKPELFNHESRNSDAVDLQNFNSVDVSGYYVLSKNFYLKQYRNISKLELLVLNFLQNKPLIVDDFFSLIWSVKKENDLEQFYFIPILICLGIGYLRCLS